MRSIEGQTGLKGPGAKELMDLDEKMHTAVRSANYNLENGGIVTPGLKQKVEDTMKAYYAWVDAVTAGDEIGLKILDDLDKDLKPFINRLYKVGQLDEGAALTRAAWKPITSVKGDWERFDHYLYHPDAAGEGAIAWTRKAGRFDAVTVEKGYAQFTGEFNIEWEHYYEATLDDGVVIRYWADASDTSFSLRNRLEIRVPGGEMEAADRALTTLRTLGVEIDPPSALQQEELYLHQIAYHRMENMAQYDKTLAKLKTLSQEERVQGLRDWVSSSIGVDDVTALPGYNPAGTYQAFDQGYRTLLRPDMVGPEWDAFFERHVVWHEVHGDSGDIAKNLDRVLGSGGQMASTPNKMARGIKAFEGWSPDDDMPTGGSSYFFTRLRNVDTTPDPGIYWKSTQLRRLDAISYRGDKFGNAHTDFILDNRQTTIEQFEYIARRAARDETNFKNTLSIFDDMAAIVPHSTHERNEIIQVFKRHGIEEWPDGRRLEDVVLSPTGARKALAEQNKLPSTYGGTPYTSTAKTAKVLDDVPGPVTPTTAPATPTAAPGADDLLIYLGDDEIDPEGLIKQLGDQFEAGLIDDKTYQAKVKAVDDWDNGLIDLDTLAAKLNPSVDAPGGVPVFKEDVDVMPIEVMHDIHPGEYVDEVNHQLSTKQITQQEYDAKLAAIGKFGDGEITLQDLDKALNPHMYQTTTPAASKVTTIDWDTEAALTAEDMEKLKAKIVYQYDNDMITYDEYQAKLAAVDQWWDVKLDDEGLDKILNPHTYADTAPATTTTTPTATTTVDYDVFAPEGKFHEKVAILQQLDEQYEAGLISHQEFKDKAQMVDAWVNDTVSDTDLAQALNPQGKFHEKVPILQWFDEQYTAPAPDSSAGLTLPENGAGDSAFLTLKDKLSDLHDAGQLSEAKFKTLDMAVDDYLAGDLDYPDLLETFDVHGPKVPGTPTTTPTAPTITYDLMPPDGIGEEADRIMDQLNEQYNEGLITQEVLDTKSTAVLQWTEGDLETGQLEKILNPHLYDDVPVAAPSAPATTPQTIRIRDGDDLDTTAPPSIRPDAKKQAAMPVYDSIADKYEATELSFKEFSTKQQALDKWVAGTIDDAELAAIMGDDLPDGFLKTTAPGPGPAPGPAPHRITLPAREADVTDEALFRFANESIAQMELGHITDAQNQALSDAMELYSTEQMTYGDFKKTVSAIQDEPVKHLNALLPATEPTTTPKTYDKVYTPLVKWADAGGMTQTQLQVLVKGLDDWYEGEIPYSKTKALFDAMSA
jgi:hypothetical protein